MTQQRAVDYYFVLNPCLRTGDLSGAGYVDVLEGREAAASFRVGPY